MLKGYTSAASLSLGFWTHVIFAYLTKLTYLKKFVNLKTIGHHFLCLFLLLPPLFILERYFHVKICYFHVKILFTYTFCFFKFWFENITPLFILPFLLSLSGSHVLCVSRIIIIILSYLFFVCFDDPATIYFLPSCSHSHAKLCVSLDYCYFYFYLFCLFGWIPPLFIFHSFVLSLPCKTLCLSRLLLLLFLSILSFWTDPSTIYFLLLRAFPPMQDFVSLPIIIIFILFSFVFLDGPWHYFFFTPCSPSHAELWVSWNFIFILVIDISAPKMRKYPHPLFFYLLLLLFTELNFPLSLLWSPTLSFNYSCST